MKNLGNNSNRKGFDVQVLLHVRVSFTRWDGAYLYRVG